MGYQGSLSVRSICAMYADATKQYYAEWTDTDPSVFDEQTVITVCSPKRDTRQYGYSRSFQLYCVITDSTVVISYSRRLEESISRVAEVLKHSKDSLQVIEILQSILLDKIGHNYKYYFTALPNNIDTSEAVQLGREDLQHYKSFFESQYPGVSFEGMQDYFYSVACRGYSYGVFRENRLVCATDAPGIPYMRDIIVEPGINTLKEYRRCGYAKITTGALIKYLLETGKVPIWSCAAANEASDRLARSLGFVKFADVFSLSMAE